MIVMPIWLLLAALLVVAFAAQWLGERRGYRQRDDDEADIARMRSTVRRRL